MKSDILLADAADIYPCAELIFESDIGRQYYHDLALLAGAVQSGTERREIFIRKSDGILSGVLWFVPKGMFASFPYLKILVVRSEYQGRGIASEMMDFYEDYILSCGGKTRFFTKSFVVTATENPALSMYLHRGYQEITEIQGLFKKGIDEKLLMKIVYSRSRI